MRSYTAICAECANGSSLAVALQAYKAAAIGIIKEYMVSADTTEVAEALKELGQPDLQHIFREAGEATLLATAFQETSKWACLASPAYH